MSAWKPREHDHLVEPFLAGLPARPGREEPTDSSSPRERRRLSILAAIAGLLIASRIVVLLLR